ARHPGGPAGAARRGAGASDSQAREARARARLRGGPMGVINKVLEGFGPVKKLVPKGVKQAAKKSLLEQALRRALRRVAALPEGEVPSRALLADLLTAWSNDGFAADLDYLEEV